MRTNIELAKLVLKELREERNVKLETGLCRMVHAMRGLRLITLSEKYRIYNLIEKYRPENKTNYFYFFPDGDKKPRIKFLQRVIRLEKIK